jgi:transcription elongation factor Elf1
MAKQVHQFECNCGGNLFAIVRSLTSGRTYVVCDECGNEFAINVVMSMLPIVVNENHRI